MKIRWERKQKRDFTERGEWLLLREQRIADLEREIEQMQAIVREREKTITDREELTRFLEQHIAELKSSEAQNILRIEIEQREAAVRQREARILALEATVDGRNAEIELLRSALRQAQDVLRKRGANFLFLERQPRPLSDPLPETPDNNLIEPDSEESSPAAVLEEWRRSAPDFANAGLSDNAELIDPYILEKHLCGFPIRVLIGTRQSQQWYDRFEITEAPFLDALQMIRPGDTVFDCGAHHGVHSLLYSRMVGQAGRVLAFDPFPINLKIAKLNAVLNNRSNIEFFDVAITSRSGSTNASIAEQCIVLERQNADDLLPLKLAALDEFAERQPNFIKIDIEGAEVDALEGACDVLRQKPCLYIEMHPVLLPRFGKAMMDIFRFIDIDNYRCFVNYPGKEALLKYRRQFDLVLPCALFFVPRDRPPLLRYYTA